MKNLLRTFLLAVFMLFVVNAFAIEPSGNPMPKAKQVQIQAAPTFHITSPLHKTDTGKSQLVALLLALFLGEFGVHSFYLGYKKKGMFQLLLGGGGFLLTIILGFIVPPLAILGSLAMLAAAIWALIDIINILTGKLTPANGDYSETL